MDKAEKEKLTASGYVALPKKPFPFPWKDHFKEKFGLKWDTEDKVWLISGRRLEEFQHFREEIKSTVVIRPPDQKKWDYYGITNSFLATWNKEEKFWTVPLIFADEFREALGVQ